MFRLNLWIANAVAFCIHTCWTNFFLFYNIFSPVKFFLRQRQCYAAANLNEIWHTLKLVVASNIRCANIHIIRVFICTVYLPHRESVSICTTWRLQWLTAHILSLKGVVGCGILWRNWQHAWHCLDSSTLLKTLIFKFHTSYFFKRSTKCFTPLNSFLRVTR